MQVVFSRGEPEVPGEPASPGREVDLRLSDPTATVGDAVEALLAADLPAGAAVRVDGRPVDRDLSLAEAGVLLGSEIRLGPPRSREVHAGPVEVAVVGGLDAGATVRVGAGPVLLGRLPGAAPSAGGPDRGEGPALLPLSPLTVSREHARLDVGPAGVTVTDLESRNGTWVAGVRTQGPTPVPLGETVRCGFVGVRVGPPAPDDRPRGLDPLRQATSAGTVPFNRAPRPALPDPLPALRPPEAPAAVHRPTFSLAAILAPMAFAAVMVVALNNLLYALFGLLSPVMAVATYVEQRRRAGKSARAGGREHAEAVAAFHAAVAGQHATEVARRRAATPTPPEVLRRAEGPSQLLWERRALAPDLLRLSVGLGDVPWRPELTGNGVVAGAAADPSTPGVAAALAVHGVLPEVPVTVDLADGGVVGLVGDRAAIVALARWLLCQVAVQSGPADARVAVLADDDRRGDWDWAKWLPHTRDLDGGDRARFLAAGPAECRTLVDRLIAFGPDPDEVRRHRLAGDAKPGAPVSVVVVDAVDLLEGRGAPGRALLRGAGGQVAGIVLAPTEDRLPAVCTVVVTVHDADGMLTVSRMDTATTGQRAHATGLSDATARRCARALARYDDPELHVSGAGLPERLDLLPLLGLPEVTAEQLLARWAAADEDPGAAAPVGRTPTSPYVLDLVRDGPHGLVGGTTGSGKSELLRTLVASLATTADPDHLTFVLIDYKGGSAFDECARLPHTVGLVTDLDEHLGERALRCLEAELHHRERVLRAAGATDLPSYLARVAPGAEPLPRLVVVVDEFATMAAELPDFLTALVGIAQRGRSLGVHLLLATQRPSGAVNENIKANTNLRVALRVQSTADSTDVVDAPDAAGIGRESPGRAFVRLGPGELVAVQSALVTGRSGAGRSRPVEPAAFLYGPTSRPADPPRPPATGPSDLERLVTAARSAFDTTGRPAPRRPWPEALPAVLPPGALGSTDPDDPTVLLGLADDPDRQAQYPVGWARDRGNLLVVGVTGAGTTTALRTVALTLAGSLGPDRLHLHVLDAGAGELMHLADLPHAGSVVGPTETERQVRLVGWLKAELDRRREAGAVAAAVEPEIVVLLDGYAAFAAAHDGPTGLDLLDALARVFSDGPEVGMRMVLSADRSGAVPPALAAVAGQKLVLRLADSYDYGAFGLRASDIPTLPPGRAVRAEDGLLVQLARTTADTPVLPWPAPARAPHRVGTLPDEVRAAAVRPAAPDAGSADEATTGWPDPWLLPLGVDDATLAPALLPLYEGEHLTVAGPARSGRSSTLVTVAEQARAAVDGLTVLTLAHRRSPLRELVCDGLGTDTVTSAALLRPLVAAGAGLGPTLLLVDDADAVDDPEGLLAALLAARQPGLRIAVAGRPEGLRTAYGHWTATVRRSRAGLLLRPDIDLDGDLLGVRLPRRTSVPWRAGRGYLVADGEVRLVQAALPT